MFCRLTVVVIACFFYFGPAATLADQRLAETTRPKVAIVLGGGGGHGVAHLGVLRALEQLKVPIDLVVGTGFGGIIGGLYASGMSSTEIHNFLLETDWLNIFDPDSQRQDLSFRRKLDDADYLIKYRVGIKDGKAQLPTSLVPSEKLARLLQTVTADSKGIKNFDVLPIPFRAVAMDLLTGDEIILDSGALDRAMVATSSSPGTLPPVKVDGRLLITGSLVNNLPIDVARSWGADVIIVVDIGSYVRAEDDLSSIFAVVDQVSHLLLQKNSEASILQLKTTDILLQPKLYPYNETVFDNLENSIDKGAESVINLADSFADIRLNEREYAALYSSRVARRTVQPVISRIELHNESNVDDELILAQLSQTLILKQRKGTCC